MVRTPRDVIIMWFLIFMVVWTAASIWWTIRDIDDDVGEYGWLDYLLFPPSAVLAITSILITKTLTKKRK